MHVTGGVSANGALRSAAEQLVKVWNKSKGASVVLRTPPRLEFCTDNGAMIAAAAYFQHQKEPARYEWFSFAEMRAGF